MKDSIFTKLTALVLLLAIAGGSAFAQQKKLGFQGRPSNLHEQNQYNMIDYDLIKNDLGARKVTVTIGEHSFQGKILRDGMSLPQERVDEIAAQVFKDMGLNMGKMTRITDDLAGVNLGPTIDWMTFTEDICALAGVGFPAVGAVGDLISVANGDEGALQGFYNVGSAFLITATISGTIAAPVLGTTMVAVATIANFATGADTLTGKLPSALRGVKQITDFLVDLADGKPTARRCMESALIHYDYYRRVNALISQEIMKNNKAGNWMLKVDESSYRYKTLFNVKVHQFAHLTMNLERKERIGQAADHNWQGAYEGYMELRFLHDLDYFDDHFKEELVGNLPFSKLGYIDFPDDATGPKSALYKKLTNPKFRIDLASSDGTITGAAKRTFKMDGFDDYSHFDCSKHIVGKANIGTWKEGKFRFAHFTGNAQMDLDFLGSLTDNKCSVALKVLDQKDAWEVNTWFHHFGGKDEMVPFNASGTAVFVDGTVFEDLKKQKFISVDPVKNDL